MNSQKTHVFKSHISHLSQKKTKICYYQNEFHQKHLHFPTNSFIINTKITHFKGKKR